MTKEESRAERLYQTTMHLARKMFKEGTITADEYGQIEKHFAEKYQPITGTLFSSLSLT